MLEVELPLVVIISIISLILVFDYVLFYVSFCKKTSIERANKADNTPTNNANHDDPLAKVLLRSEMVRRNILVKQINGVDCMREFSLQLTISRGAAHYSTTDHCNIVVGGEV